MLKVISFKNCPFVQRVMALLEMKGVPYEVEYIELFATELYQELWGILISYNIVRLEMAAMGKEHKVEPLRISFINALYLIQDEFIWCDGRSPGTIPKKLKALRENGRRLILPKKRKRPSYLRAVLQRPRKYLNRKATRS